MATALLVVIYIAYIGLGLPDSILGVAWPAMYTQLGLPVSMAGFLSMTVTTFTVVSSLLSPRLVRRFGTGVITGVSTALTVVGLLGYAVSPHPVFFFLLAPTLGLGAGAIDTVLNSYVAMHYSAAKLNFLHCFYGIGVAAAPWLMSLALGADDNWRRGYLIVGSIQAVIAFVTLVSIPLWRKIEKKEQEQEGETQRVLTLGELAKIPAVRMNCLVFFACCAVELTFGGWSSTYFVTIRGLEADRAALVTMLYYAGLACGRFLSGVFARKLSDWQMIWIASGILLCSILAMLLPVGTEACAVVLFFAGLGVGPLFPNLTHLAPRIFGREIAQSVIAAQMSSTYVGILLMPPLFGMLAQFFTAALLPWFQLVMLGIYLAALTMLHKHSKNNVG